jgi:hypothetical protein
LIDSSDLVTCPMKINSALLLSFVGSVNSFTHPPSPIFGLLDLFG